MFCPKCGFEVNEDAAFCPKCGAQLSAINISGSTVKVDNSSELKNLFELARRAKDNNNSENAQKFYEQILVKDPSSWEANFYSVYYQSMNCKIAGIQSAAVRLTNTEDTVLQLIRDNVSDPAERRKAVDEIGGKLISISTMLYNAAENHYNGIGASIKANYTQEYLNNCCAARDILYTYGDLLIQFFGDEYGKAVAVPCWQTGITQHNKLVPKFQNKQVNADTINSYGEKIKKYDPTYQTPAVNTSATGGCYVATAVYGSYDCPQVWTLRRYRDDTLASTWYGRAFIHTYYAVSPTLVKWFGKTEWFRNMWKPKLDKMVERLNGEGVEDTPYADRRW